MEDTAEAAMEGTVTRMVHAATRTVVTVATEHPRRDTTLPGDTVQAATDEDRSNNIQVLSQPELF